MRTLRLSVWMLTVMAPACWFTADWLPRTRVPFTSVLWELVAKTEIACTAERWG